MKAQIEAYRQFHGIDPERVTITNGFWLPGGLVRMGAALDTGYRITIPGSQKEKDQEYIHDHKDGVKLYRRARRGERADKTMRVLSKDWLLGKWLGATYMDEDTGDEHEVGGGRLNAISPNEKILFVSDSKGVKYVITGGSFRIRDWMYD